MSKATLGMGIAAAVVVAGCVVVMVWQRQTIAELELEIAGLQQQAGLAETLQAENKRLRNSTVDPDELDRLRKGHTELMRLRNEVSQLRRQAQESASAKAAPAQPTRAPAPPPLPARLPAPAAAPTPVTVPNRETPFLPTESWADVGLATPEAAFQTLHWAMRTGNLDRMAEALLLPPEEPPPGSEMIEADVLTDAQTGAPIVADPDSITHDLLADMTSASPMQDVKGSRVLAQRQVAPDEVELSIEMERADGSRSQVPMTFKRVGDEWKLAPTMIGVPTGTQDTGVVPRR